MSMTMDGHSDKILKSNGIFVGHEEHTIKWADHVGIDMENDSSITSEEETGEFDDEQRSRAKPAQEIWDEAVIGKELQALPDAEEIQELLQSEEDTSLIFKKNKRTAILLSTWLGKTNIVTKLIEQGVSVETSDDSGRTVLHLAALGGHFECLKLFLDHKAKAGVWDSKKKATPLHCAASVGHLACLKLLIRHGADVNAGISNRSPLHYAVQSLAIDCVKELLEHNAVPNTPQVFSEAPIHVAAALGASEILQLLLKYGAAVNVQCGSEKLTPLHLAAEDGCAECSKHLIEAGATVNSRNHKKQTPLHLAALSQCSETLELLLSKGADPNIGDVDGRTPLHGSIVKVTRSCECVKLLLNAGANPNKPDAFGYTPLHLAALNEFSNCVMLLLNHGGDVTIRTKGGISVLSFITRKIPDVIPKYISKFDQAIKINDHEIGDVDCELKLDFRILVPTMGNKETELLLNFIEVGHRDVLKHPLIETFLFLKWRRIRKFFLFSLFYHNLFVFLFSRYVVGVFVRNCPQAKTFRVCSVDKDIPVIGYILICFNIMFLVKELFQVAHNWFTYIKQWENWLQCSIIVCVFSSVQPKFNMIVDEDVPDWQHHVAAIGIFLAWLELMLIVGRFPSFGLYVQMFQTVSINFVKFIVAYFYLLVAFALSFGVIFANYPSFKNLTWVLLKVIIMMSGELEFEDIFFDDNYPIYYPTTAHIMFLCFVLLVTIILTNLMVGLAVSDIQGLQQSAGLDRLVRQAQLVAHLESMLFSRLLGCIPHKLMNFFHQQALLLNSQYHWALYIKPNDPREERIPKDLIKSIFQLVTERKELPKNRKKRSKYVFTSPPLSRMSSYSSVGNNKNPNILKQHLEEMNNEFLEFSRMFRNKMENLTNQIANS